MREDPEDDGRAIHNRAPAPPCRLPARRRAMIDGGTYADPATGEALFAYAHPIFWAPFTLIGDSG